MHSDNGVLRGGLRHRQAAILQRQCVQRLVVVPCLRCLRQSGYAASAAAERGVGVVSEGGGGCLAEVPSGDFMMDVLKVV